MKITFIKDCPPILASGNSAYKEGAQADLRMGEQLVNAGYAREGWGQAKVEPSVELKVEYIGPPYYGVTDDELRELAKAAGIKGYARMKRETLIQRLSDGNN